MDKTFVPIIEALTETLASMGGETPVVVLGKVELSELAVLITLQGSPGIKVWLSASKQSLGTLYETAMGWYPDEEQEFEDFLGEVANQTLGPAAILLPDVDPNSLGIPQLSAEWEPEKCWQVRGTNYEFCLGVARDLAASTEQEGSPRESLAS